MGGFSSKSSTGEMSEEKLLEVKAMINKDLVVIFSKSYCPYCKLAKDVFESLKKQYTAIELDTRADGDEIQAILFELTGERTVPRVFVKGECLGGGSDVKRLHDNGKLQAYFD